MLFDEPDCFELDLFGILIGFCDFVSHEDTQSVLNSRPAHVFGDRDELCPLFDGELEEYCCALFGVTSRRAHGIISVSFLFAQRALAAWLRSSRRALRTVSFACSVATYA